MVGLSKEVTVVAEDLHILDIAENDRWVTRAADVMQAAIEQAIRLRGRCLFGLSGGSTPTPVFVELASRPIEWDNVCLLQVDERIAPVGSPDRNLTNQQAAFASTEASWFPLPVDEVLDVINDSAQRELSQQSESLGYIGELDFGVDGESSSKLVSDVLADFDASLVGLAGAPPVLDLVHLGLGADGHTASLFPGDSAVNELLLFTAMTGDYQGTKRITLTRPVIDRARMAVWLVRGTDKREPLGRLLQGDMTIPAGLLRPAHSVIVADGDAACQS